MMRSDNIHMVAGGATTAMGGTLKLFDWREPDEEQVWYSNSADRQILKGQMDGLYLIDEVGVDSLGSDNSTHNFAFIISLALADGRFQPVYSSKGVNIVRGGPDGMGFSLDNPVGTPAHNPLRGDWDYARNVMPALRIKLVEPVEAQAVVVAINDGHGWFDMARLRVGGTQVSGFSYRQMDVQMDALRNRYGVIWRAY